MGKGANTKCGSPVMSISDDLGIGLEEFQVADESRYFLDSNEAKEGHRKLCAVRAIRHLTKKGMSLDEIAESLNIDEIEMQQLSAIATDEYLQELFEKFKASLPEDAEQRVLACGELHYIHSLSSGQIARVLDRKKTWVNDTLNLSQVPRRIAQADVAPRMQVIQADPQIVESYLDHYDLAYRLEDQSSMESALRAIDVLMAPKVVKSYEKEGHSHGSLPVLAVASSQIEDHHLREGRLLTGFSFESLEASMQVSSGKRVSFQGKDNAPKVDLTNDDAKTGTGCKTQYAQGLDVHASDCEYKLLTHSPGENFGEKAAGLISGSDKTRLLRITSDTIPGTDTIGIVYSWVTLSNEALTPILKMERPPKETLVELDKYGMKMTAYRVSGSPDKRKVSLQWDNELHPMSKFTSKIWLQPLSRKPRNWSDLPSPGQLRRQTQQRMEIMLGKPDMVGVI